MAAASALRIGAFRRSRPLRLATVLAAGLLGYVAVAWPLNWLARTLLGEPRSAVITHKLDFLRAHADTYDILLVGSSRFHYDVDPAVLDAAAAEAGCRVRTFNFGVQGLTAAEQSWLTGKLAEIGGRRPKAVLIERPQLPLGTWQYAGSERHRIGHGDLHQIWLSTQALLTSERGRAAIAVNIGNVVLGYLYDQLGPGQLAHLLEPQPSEVPADGFTIDLSRDGFVPLEQEVSPRLKARADRMDWAEFATRLENLRTEPPVPHGLSPMRLDHMRTQIAEARRVTPQVVLTLLPQAIRSMVDDSASIVEAAATGAFGSLPILDLADPLAHPQLFADGIWFDDDHLLGDGVPRVSRELGRMLCAGVPGLDRES